MALFPPGTQHSAGSPVAPNYSYTAPTPQPAAPAAAGQSLGLDWNQVAGLAGVGSQLAGAGMRSVGIREQGEAEASAAEYNASLARLRGRQEAAQIRRANHKITSSQYTQQSGKSGLIMEQGGNLEALVSNYGAREVEALNAVIAGRNTARLYESRADYARRAAKQSSTASIMSGVTTALGAISRIV